MDSMHSIFYTFFHSFSASGGGIQQQQNSQEVK